MPVVCRYTEKVFFNFFNFFLLRGGGGVRFEGEGVYKSE